MKQTLAATVVVAALAFGLTVIAQNAPAPAGRGQGPAPAAQAPAIALPPVR